MKIGVNPAGTDTFGASGNHVNVGWTPTTKSFSPARAVGLKAGACGRAAWGAACCAATRPIELKTMTANPIRKYHRARIFILR